MVRIQPSQKIILKIVYFQLYWKDENKEKRGWEWPIKNDSSSDVSRESSYILFCLQMIKTAN